MTAVDMKLPENLPNPANAKLPGSYEAAKQHLAECAQIDECKTWADKAEALASYARQADDDELEAFARRVRARAIRRCGELLREIAPNKGGRPAKTTEGDHRSFTRSEAARDAGLSEHQQNTALRVANVPEPEFEEAVEAPKPATVTELARQGTKSKPKPLVDLQGRDPEEFAQATRIDGAVRELAGQLTDADPKAVVRGLFPRERRDLSENATTVMNWLAALFTELETADGPE